MTHLGRDTAIEERLGRALGHLADTTTVSPHGWERVEQRASARRRRRRLVTAWVGAPALAAAMVVALVAVTGTGPRRDPTVSAGPPAGPAFFAPVGLDGEFRLSSTSTGSGYRAVPGGTVRVYGRRSGDGLTLDASVLVVTSVAGDADLIGSGTQAAGKPATIRGRDLVVSREGDHTKVVWVEPDGRAVGVLGVGVNEGDIVSVAEELVLDAAGARATLLPGGFVEVHDGLWPPEPGNLAERVTLQSWVATGGGPDGFLLTVSEGPGLSLDSVVWLYTGAGVTQVAGRDALYDPGTSTISWLPRRPGVLLVLSAPGRDEATVRALAEKVEPVDEVEWRRLTRTAVGGGPAPAPTAVITTGDVAGTRWDFVVYEMTGTRTRLCVEISTEGGAMGTCVEADGTIQIGRPEIISGPDAIVGDFLVATVGKEVAAGRVERADGTVSAVGVSGASAGLPVNFLVVPLSGSAAPKAIVALDTGGRELSRQTVPQPPPASGPVPADVGPPPFTPAPPSTGG